MVGSPPVKIKLSGFVFRISSFNCSGTLSGVWLIDNFDAAQKVHLKLQTAVGFMINSMNCPPIKTLVENNSSFFQWMNTS